MALPRNIGVRTFLNLVRSGLAASLDNPATVSDAAARLQISEYAVFERAYAQWHGSPAENDELALCFRRYLFRSTVPHWVRHYCRSANDVPAPPGTVKADGLRCLAVGAYLVVCLVLAGSLAYLY